MRMGPSTFGFGVRAEGRRGDGREAGRTLVAAGRGTSAARVGGTRGMTSTGSIATVRISGTGSPTSSNTARDGMRIDRPSPGTWGRAPDRTIARTREGETPRRIATWSGV